MGELPKINVDRLYNKVYMKSKHISSTTTLSVCLRLYKALKKVNSYVYKSQS